MHIQTLFSQLWTLNLLNLGCKGCVSLEQVSVVAESDVFQTSVLLPYLTRQVLRRVATLEDEDWK